MAKKPRGTRRPDSRATTSTTPDESPSTARAGRTRWWRTIGTVAGLAVALAIAVGAFLHGRATSTIGVGDADRSPLPAPPRTAVIAAVNRADFIGAERCATCHQAQYTAWSRSTHGRAGGSPANIPVLAPFDGTPIRFRDATVIPERRGARFTFTVQQSDERDVVLTVDGAIGGGHMQGGGTQGFVSRWNDGTWRFLPFDYSRQGKEWFCNTESRANKGWVPITGDMSLSECADWPPQRVLGEEPRFTNCQSCHGSQIDVHFDTVAKRWETRVPSLAINCESCHGPGRRHLALVASGRAGADGDIGMRPLATLSKDRSLDVCFQCHAIKSPLAAGYLPGESLQAHYSLQLDQLGDAPYHPDGRVRTFAYQQGHLYSDCYRNGGMTCTSCHDPHSQGYRDVNGVALDGRFDDRQCTSCHASKSDVQSAVAHTRHAAGSPGSRCVACHMPYLQQTGIGRAVRYARSDHAIPIPRPAFDSTLGIQSACKQCHQQRSEAQLDADVRRMWGTIKPHAPIVDALLNARTASDRARAGRLALDPDSPFDAAVFQGLAWFLETHLGADMPGLERDIVDRLERLGRRDDPDIQAIALASLHYAAGTDHTVRAFIRERLLALGGDDRDDLVRRRWAIVLGFLGDRAREKGDGAGAVVAYEKALEIEPQDPHLLLNLGLAYSQAGEPARAVSSYQRSLAIAPQQPLALVNMGLALEAENDLAHAVESYRLAIALNPFEALAYFDLGNSYLRRGDAAGAIPLYERATSLDPSLALAHLYLGRSYAATGKPHEALLSTRRALRTAPDNEEARSLQQQLIASGAK